MKINIYTLFVVTFFLVIANSAYTQNVGINTTAAAPNPSAILDLNTGNAGNVGFLAPQASLLSNTDVATIPGPATGLIIYNTNAAVASGVGYYYWNGVLWAPTSGKAGTWLLTGNSNSMPATNWIGTNDANALQFKVNGKNSGWIDYLAASANTFFGYEAGIANTGSNNTGIGYSALTSNIAGTDNTAVGYDALFHNTASNNTAVGYYALVANTSGQDNAVFGLEADWLSTNANDNSAFGDYSLNNTIAGFNTAMGFQSGKTNSSGSLNTYLGTQADANATNLSNVTAVGAQAVVTASNNMMFGNTSVVGWGFGASPLAGTQALIVGTNATNGNGANLTLTGNWTSTSDSTKKRNVQNISYGLEEILKLRPVSYTWKGTNIKDIGFLAQEVKHILPEVVYGEQGHMTLSYGQITPVLTKAIQEQQQMINDLKAENEKLKNQNKIQESKIDNLQNVQAQDEADIASLKKNVNLMMRMQTSAK